MSAHTPGPWSIAGGNVVYKLDDRGNVNRFYAQVCAGYIKGKRVLKEEISANTHLIAAAPDLLFALEACLARLGAANQYIGCEEEIEQASAAIKKALGKP